MLNDDEKSLADNVHKRLTEAGVGACVFCSPEEEKAYRKYYPKPQDTPVYMKWHRKILASDVIKNEINNPPHYTAHPSGVECITITEHMSFNLGNVIKYIWRADEKGKDIEDLEKAAWYLNREINKRKGTKNG